MRQFPPWVWTWEVWEIARVMLARSIPMRRCSRYFRIAAWFALVATASMVLQSALHGRALAMAAPLSGYATICTADGIRLAPVDTGLPAPEDGRPEHAGWCQDCCTAVPTALAGPQGHVLVPWAVPARLAPNPAWQPQGRIDARFHARGPPAI